MQICVVGEIWWLKQCIYSLAICSYSCISAEEVFFLAAPHEALCFCHNPYSSVRESQTLLMPKTHRRRRRDETVLSRRRRRCEHEFATSSRRLPTASVDNLETDQTDCIALDYTNWLIDIANFFNNDVIMLSLLKKLSISIKIRVVNQPWSLFGQFSNCRPNPSAVVVS